MTEYLVSISYRDWYRMSGPDQHAIFHTTSKSQGALRIEAICNSDRMLPLVVFRGECSELVPVPEVHEALGLAEDIIIYAGHEGVSLNGIDRLDFYFANTDAAVLFKLTWGGVA